MLAHIYVWTKDKLTTAVADPLRSTFIDICSNQCVLVSTRDLLTFSSSFRVGAINREGMAPGPITIEIDWAPLVDMEFDPPVTSMTVDAVIAGQERTEFPFPTPPASDDGNNRGKRDDDAADSGGGSDDDCKGCRKIRQDEVWRLQRQKKSIGEWKFLVWLPNECGCGCASLPVPASSGSQRDFPLSV